MSKECDKTKSIRVISIDKIEPRKVYFEQPLPENIWSDVIRKDKDAFINLCKVFKSKGFTEEKIKKILRNSLSWFIYHLFYKHKGHFIKESDWLSQQSNNILTKPQMALIQRSYTLSHVKGYKVTPFIDNFIENDLGCSTVCIWDNEAQQTICMRSLDWAGAMAISHATRCFEHVNSNGDIEYKSVGVVGMLGVLTGIKKGFSVVINFAPWSEPSSDWQTDPTFKLRQLLENKSIDSYKKAKQNIIKWKIASPVFITLCGKEKDEACVIEMPHNDIPYVRESKNGLLIQTNHYDVINSPYKKHNVQFNSNPVDSKNKVLDKKYWYCGKLLPGSKKRYDDLNESLNREFKSSEELNKELERAYRTSPLWNFETAYWAKMWPKTGSISIYTRPNTPNIKK